MASRSVARASNSAARGSVAAQQVHQLIGGHGARCPPRIWRTNRRPRVVLASKLTMRRVSPSSTTSSSSPSRRPCRARSATGIVTCPLLVSRTLLLIGNSNDAYYRDPLLPACEGRSIVAGWPAMPRTCQDRVPMKRPYRVVVAKPGLDGHDRGARVIARALREAGFEVIYTGLHQTPEQIAETAIQEDADAVGLSILSGAHMTLFPRIVEEMNARGGGDVLVFAGGIIPDADIAVLAEIGVARVFTPGAPLGDITGWLELTLDDREQSASDHDDGGRDVRPGPGDPGPAG